MRAVTGKTRLPTVREAVWTKFGLLAGPLPLHEPETIPFILVLLAKRLTLPWLLHTSLDADVLTTPKQAETLSHITPVKAEVLVKYFRVLSERGLHEFDIL